MAKRALVVVVALEMVLLVISTAAYAIQIDPGSAGKPITAEMKGALLNAWFADFPREEGFPAVYLALTDFFERPKWTYISWAPGQWGQFVVTGYAYLDGQKTKFTVSMFVNLKAHRVRLGLDLIYAAAFELPKGYTGVTASGYMLNGDAFLTSVYLPD
jgi:hypothetical protein